MIEVLTTNFDAYVHSPLRVAVTAFGVSSVTINVASSVDSWLPQWAQAVLVHILSFPYMPALTFIGTVLIIIERYYSTKIKRLEAKKLERQIERGEV